MDGHRRVGQHEDNMVEVRLHAAEVCLGELVLRPLRAADVMSVTGLDTSLGIARRREVRVQPAADSGPRRGANQTEVAGGAMAEEVAASRWRDGN